MITGMLPLGLHFQIFNSVVSLDFVDMMHYFIFCQGSTKMFLHDFTMFPYTFAYTVTIVVNPEYMPVI